MRALPHEIAIGILGNEFEPGFFPDPNSVFDGKEGAREFLRNLTEEDFGDDCVKWRVWFQACSREMLDLHYEEWKRKSLITDRDARIKYAESRWANVTTRRCPNCGGLCPEYRNHSWVCDHTVGRVLA
jgi:hypothetical protein